MLPTIKAAKSEMKEVTKSGIASEAPNDDDINAARARKPAGLRYSWRQLEHEIYFAYLPWFPNRFL